MRKSGLTLLFSLFIATNVQAEKPATTTSIFNLTDRIIPLWINGVPKEIPVNGAITSPCLPEEHTEIQIGESVTLLNCGDKFEVNQ